MLYFWASVLKWGPDKHGEQLNFWMAFHCRLLQLQLGTLGSPDALEQELTGTIWQCSWIFQHHQCISVVLCLLDQRPNHSISPLVTQKDLEHRQDLSDVISKQMPCATQKSQRMSLMMMCGCGFFQSCLIARPCLVMTCRDLCDLEKPRTETFLAYKAREHELTGGDGETTIPHNFDIK